MSEQPMTPAPEAPASEAPLTPTFTEPAAAAPESTPKPKEGNDDPSGVDALPEWAQKEIRQARREAQNARGSKNQAVEAARNELAQSIGKAIGLVKDDEPVDPAALMQDLTSSRSETKQTKTELAVFRASLATDADPVALLDSRAFLEKIATLDPADTAAITAAIGEAVQNNPRLGKASEAVTPGMKPNPAQGRSASPPATVAEQIAAATAAGDTRTVMRLKAAQAMNTQT